jgi:hypothetical protein
MKYRLANLRDYPFQPIRLKDFAKARNHFIQTLPDNEYVLFTSDHEEVPAMLHDYISKLEPRHPYYMIRLLRFVNGHLEPLFDPKYQPNLCSNRMRFVGVPERPDRGGMGWIDIPMLHNKNRYSHGYATCELPASWLKKYAHVFFRLYEIYRQVMWDELGRGMFRKGQERLY